MGYITLAGSAFENISYTIRGFTPDKVPTEVTVLDQDFHSSTYLGSLGVGSAAYMPEVFKENWIGSGGLTQTELDGLQINTVLDDANRASGAAGTAWTNDLDGQGYSALVVAGSAFTSDGLGSTYTAARSWWNPTSFNANHEAYTTLLTTNGTAGLAYRVSNPGIAGTAKGYQLDFSAGSVFSLSTFQGNEVVNVVWAGTTSSALAGTTVFGVQTSSNKHYVWYQSPSDSSPVLMKIVEDSTFLSGSVIGLKVEDGSSVDNFGGGNISSVYTQTVLDGLSQSLLSGDTYVVDDFDGTYNVGLQITNVSTSGVSSESRVLFDDLSASPFDGTADTYYIQMAVWDFPSSATADLTNCYVAFTSSETYAPGETATIAFDSVDLLTDSGTVAAGGDFTWRINRDTLSTAGVDISQLRKIKIGMQSVTGTFDFKCSDLKLVRDDYDHYNVGVNTKVGRLKQERWPNESQSAMPAILQNTFTSQDYTYVVKFNSGTLPSGNDNEFSIYTRVDPDRGSNPNSYLKFNLVSNDTLTTINAYEGTALLYSHDGAPLSANKDHVLLITLEGSNTKAEVWDLDSYRLKTLKVDTNSRATSIVQEGYVGFDFTPYYGDFQIDYMYAKDIVVAEYVSKSFESVLPVDAIAFFPQNSSYSNLINFDFEESQAVDNLIRNYSDSGQHNATLSTVLSGINDVSVVEDTNVTVAGSSLKVTKNLKNAYVASVRYPSVFVANDLSLATVAGYLRFESGYETTKKSNGNYGAFRVVLWDKWFQKPIYIGDIQNVTANKWNSFEVPIIADIYENEMNIEVQHCGTASTDTSASFWLEGVEVRYKDILWEASNNDGKTWISFYDNTNDPYRTINFPNDVYDHLVKNNDIELYWKLGEVGGAIAVDSSFNGNNGLYAGTANITYNVSGTEILKTDPDNTAIRLTSGGSVFSSGPTGLSTDAITVNSWIRTGTAISQDVLVQSGTADGTWKLQTTASGVSFSIYSGGTASIVASATFDYADDIEPVGVLPGTPAWHQLTATYNREYASLYIDGVLKATTPGTVALNTSGTVSAEGPSSGYRYQDEIEIYSSALPEKDIKRHYIAATETYNKLKIRAKAYSADSWISGYQVIPYYSKPGRYLETPTRYINPNSIASESSVEQPTFDISIGMILESIDSAEAFGTPSVYTSNIYPDSITTAEDVRTPTITNISPIPSYRSVASNEAYGGTSLAINAPAGVAVGDILVAVLGIRDEAYSVSASWPDGWSSIGAASFDTGTTDRHFHVAWQTYTGDALGTVTFGGTATNASVGVAAYSGASGVWGYNSPVTHFSASGTTLTPNSLSVPYANSRVIFAAYLNDFASMTNPGSFVTRQHILNSFIADAGQASAGTASGTWTMSSYADAAGMLLFITNNT